MLAELFAVLAPVLIAAGIGYGWVRSGHAYPTDFVARLVLNIGTPCLVLSTLSRAELDLGAFSQMALACVLVTCAMGAIGWLLSRLFAIDWKVLVPAPTAGAGRSVKGRGDCQAVGAQAAGGCVGGAVALGAAVPGWPAWRARAGHARSAAARGAGRAACSESCGCCGP